MIGGIGLTSGSSVTEKTYIVTFKITPEDAIVVVKDSNGLIVDPKEGNTYELKAGDYTYTVTADGYTSIVDKPLEINNKKKIKVSLEKKLEVYGIKRNIANSETIWDRLELSRGKVANAVQSKDTIDTTQNDFDNIYPWNAIKTCSLNKSGSILKYIDDAGWSWSDSTLIMTEIPDFWWNREQIVEDEATYEYIYISEKQTSLTPHKFTKRYVGRYLSSSNGDCYNTGRPYSNVSIMSARNIAKSMGTNWSLLDIETLSAIQMLYLVEYADYNSQSILGWGIEKYSYTQYSKMLNGILNDFKMKSGHILNDMSSPESAVIYRGIENIYGWYGMLIDGINFDDNGDTWICREPSQYGYIVASPYIKTYATSKSRWIYK